MSEKELLIKGILACEMEVVELYLQEGPKAVRKRFGLNEAQWAEVFAVLVLERNLAYKAVVASADFFLDIFVKYGPAHVRGVLALEDARFNGAWAAVFDFLAVALDGLKEHVECHFPLFQFEEDLRGRLMIEEEKYDGLWAEILDLLLQKYAESLFNNRSEEQSLRFFNLLYSLDRERGGIKD